ncbi:branched-chain amino acid transport system ATP-binding protein [Sedimentibacter acidaminivorans]|uniref:Branched-chain amino acid transport system ATP-binding protein n=1 Tax=Sedimentibacter acidaminivorans TaxID=913099 RepID=A0ABS4GGT6_9FIRM|nr:ABC transporter ATP-binding protein [Sedimentibacter acidaminivorans]MBP1926903.1 branched-chain amino acid transport system ATP-binding protein [Sedimentibacter acidaminivorans]
MSVLKIDNVKMQFGGVIAVNNLNIDVEKGKIVALIGPNGAGKTTAFNVITGVYNPTSGSVFLNDKKITSLSPDKITKLGIARTFQNIRLFKNLTVMDNILIANHLNVKSNFLSSALRMPWYIKEENHMRKKSEMLLDKLGLLGIKDEIASSLPYGEQRKLEIARALATDAKLLLLDEPAAGMNPHETMELTEFIRNIRDEFDLTVFMIEHHMNLVMEISDKIYVLDFGQLIAEGTADDIKNNPRVIEAYLGVEEDA